VTIFALSRSSEDSLGGRWIVTGFGNVQVPSPEARVLCWFLSSFLLKKSIGNLQGDHAILLALLTA